MDLLFDLEPQQTDKTCNECEHRQRWQCNSKTIQYCGIRKSNKTNNKLLKIKCKDKACSLFKEVNK
jgi:hypothetical protein